ncbi:hypothetical protein M422DRAFT_254090 [Sphaerobolus stellatus SS14]|uniref:Uncharacterized protein n=1 Tax=Sphaerobolus stellatus (strain SS14) TaxID=990650 RepID=A0A0C9VLK9_SPHS4|nr:hypothetical protein M422DRAFT_254090 [Sphaerobolus stellatus SS14]
MHLQQANQNAPGNRHRRSPTTPHRHYIGAQNSPSHQTSSSTLRRTAAMASSRFSTPDAIPVQPDNFYGQAGPSTPATEKGYLDPQDDPQDDPPATRSIPVFKPSMEEFADF